MLFNVAHIPVVLHHILSQRLVAAARHEYAGDVYEITITLTLRIMIFVPAVGKLNYLNAF